nr:amino acid synthesis family protein [Rhodococcus sp. (in: high G+C Gram-positive bacteria)]
MHIRKVVSHVEETFADGGRVLGTSTRTVVVAAVISNPYADSDAEDLTELVTAGGELGALLVERGVDALGVRTEEVTSYGKGAVVGTKGSLEHAAAILHPGFGGPVRRVLSPGKAIMSSAKKAGPPGATLLVPLADREDIWTFDRFDAAEITIADAPHDDEIVVALALGVGGRPGHRTRSDRV